MEEEIAKKSSYFRESTAAQRRLLFKTWEETGDIDSACRKANLSRSTFYYWKPRFNKEGYAGLENTVSHAPHHPRQIAPQIMAQIVAQRSPSRVGQTPYRRRTNEKQWLDFISQCHYRV